MSTKGGCAGSRNMTWRCRQILSTLGTFKPRRVGALRKQTPANLCSLVMNPGAADAAEAGTRHAKPGSWNSRQRHGMRQAPDQLVDLLTSTLTPDRTDDQTFRWPTRPLWRGLTGSIDLYRKLSSSHIKLLQVPPSACPHRLHIESQNNRQEIL